MALIGTDIALEVEIGNIADGSAPSFGGIINMIGIARKLHVSHKKKKIDCTGFAPIQLNRYGVTESEMEIESFVPGTGMRFYDPTALTAEGAEATVTGRNIRVSTIENSALGRRHVWTGVATEWDWSAEDDKVQAENVKIDLNPDDVTTNPRDRGA